MRRVHHSPTIVDIHADEGGGIQERGRSTETGKSSSDLSTFQGIIAANNEGTTKVVGGLWPTGCLIVVINGNISNLAPAGNGLDVTKMVAPANDDHGGGMCGLSGWTSSRTPGDIPIFNRSSGLA